MDLGTLFPVKVSSVMRRIPGEELALTLAEGVAVQRALPKRRREFAAGRACAREALRALGVQVAELPRLSDGRPAWPQGVIGTISHTSEWCAAVVTRESDVLGLGVDMEQLGTMSSGAARQVLSPLELEACEQSDLGREVAWILRFSAKESIYKCLFALVRRFIGFDEAEIAVGPRGVFEARLKAPLTSLLPASSRFEGRYKVTGDHVVTSFTLIEATD